MWARKPVHQGDAERGGKPAGALGPQRVARAGRTAKNSCRAKPRAHIAPHLQVAAVLRRLERTIGSKIVADGALVFNEVWICRAPLLLLPIALLDPPRISHRGRCRGNGGGNGDRPCLRTDRDQARQFAANSSAPSRAGARQGDRHVRVQRRGAGSRAAAAGRAAREHRYPQRYRYRRYHPLAWALCPRKRRRRGRGGFAYHSARRDPALQLRRQACGNALVSQATTWPTPT